MDLHSLYNRYAIISVVCGVLVLFAAISANNYMTNTRQQTASNIEQRSTMLARSRVVRNAVWQVREALVHFLINPEKIDNRERIYTSIGEAINNTERLFKQRRLLNKEQLSQLNRIIPLLQNLEDAANELIKIRLDSNRQFPSISMAQNELLPRQRIVFTAFAEALDESTETVLEGKKHLEIHTLLNDARYRWSITISTFRMLMASRIGSFAQDDVENFISIIEINLEDIMQKIKRLQELQRSEAIGLTTSAAIDTIEQHVNEWHDIYKNLVKLHKNEHWRGDIEQMRLNVDPLLEELWQVLYTFDVSIENGAEHDVKAITRLAQEQSNLIWSLGIAALILIVLGFFTLNKLVLSPMSMMAKAFLKEANGETEVEIPKSNSTETNHLILAFQEMRNKIRSRQDELEYQATHDALTGLANRVLLYKVLSELTENIDRKNDKHSLILMDLNRFKEVNDTLGHQIGDRLLILVAERLSALLRENDTMARLGGDEFAIVLPQTEEKDCKTVCNKILAAFEQPYIVKEHELLVGASLGVAIYPSMGVDVDTLVKRADSAMYLAKRNRLGFAIYESNRKSNNENHLSLANDLRSAIAQNSFELHYQIKNDIHSNIPIGVEALLRWSHPQFGEITPERIIPLAEQLGLINRLTLWIIDSALQQCRLWRDQGIFLSMAVNLSVYDLQSELIAEQINQMLNKYDIPASYLIVEITEGAILADPNQTINTFNKLNGYGIRIAVDDFGTGFSSLAYLRRLPINELKIDKSFVSDMLMDENDEIIVRATVELAHNLGIQVVAEGVESLEVYNRLCTLSCDTAQGYYLCKPVAADEVLNYLYAEPLSKRVTG